MTTEIMRPAHVYPRVGVALLAREPTSRAHQVATGLQDEIDVVGGRYAIKPADPSLLADLLPMVASFLESSYAPSTNRVDQSHMRAWEQITSELGTPAVRDDLAANSGADPVGYRNELILQALALIIKYVRMPPRSHEDPAADPNSAFAIQYPFARDLALLRKRGVRQALILDGRW